MSIMVTVTENRRWREKHNTFDGLGGTLVDEKDPWTLKKKEED